MKLRFLLPILLGLWVSTFSLPAFAQRDASMNSLLDKIELEGKRADRSPVPPSELSAVNMQVQWRLWKRVYGEGESGKDELKALTHDGRSVGWVNQVANAMAIAALASGEEDAGRAQEMFEASQQLAPNLPYPWLLEFIWTVENDPAKIGYWGRAFINGVKAGVKWPDTTVPWALKLVAYLMFAWCFAFVVFVAGQLLRNFPIVTYDLARLMPKGFSSNQTSVVLVALVAVPGIVAKSPLLSVLLLLAIVSLVQRKNERVVTLLAFGFIAVLPFADDALSALSSYPGSQAQRLFRAQYETCGAGCTEDLEALAASDPDDAYVRFTALAVAFRRGKTADLQRVVEDVASGKWPADVAGHAHNLSGAALVALAKPKEALEVLEKARGALPQSAAPRFNLMRAHQMLGDSDAAARALQEASSRDIEAVTQQLSYDRRDVNSFLAVELLPMPTFFKYHLEKAERTYSPIAPVWRLVAGDKLTLDEHALLLGGAGILLVLLGFPLGARTSTPCPRCGLARDPTETNKTASHVYCYPCYSTYVAGAMLDYDSRVHNEKVLGRRFAMQRLGRRVLTIVVPGLGHVMAGWSGAGFAMAFGIAFAGALVAQPLGVVRSPHELVAVNWAGQVWLAWVIVGIIALIALNAAARDIPPVIVQKDGGRR